MQLEWHRTFSFGCQLTFCILSEKQNAASILWQQFKKICPFYFVKSRSREQCGKNKQELSDFTIKWILKCTFLQKPPATSTPTNKNAVKIGCSPGFSPEKATALRQILQKKGTAKVKPDPELSKSRSESIKVKT